MVAALGSSNSTSLSSLAFGAIVAAGEQGLEEFIAIGLAFDQQVLRRVRRRESGFLRGGRDGRRREQHLQARPHAEPDEHPGDQNDRAGVDDRAGLPRHDFDQRRSGRGFEVFARIDEVDDRDLDDVAALRVEPGRRSDKLLDLLDLGRDRFRAWACRRATRQALRD